MPLCYKQGILFLIRFTTRSRFWQNLESGWSVCIPSSVLSLSRRWFLIQKMLIASAGVRHDPGDPVRYQSGVYYWLSSSVSARNRYGHVICWSGCAIFLFGNHSYQRRAARRSRRDHRLAEERSREKITNQQASFICCAPTPRMPREGSHARYPLPSAHADLFYSRPFVKRYHHHHHHHHHHFAYLSPPNDISHLRLLLLIFRPQHVCS